MIRLETVTRQFGERILFRDLSWRLTRDARIGLVGPNGAGKTTLLRLIAGRDEPDAGAVHRTRGSEVGYLPQEVETIGGDTVLGVALAGLGELGRIERQIGDLERQLAGLGADDPETERLTARYGELRQRFEGLDGDRAEARAKAVLGGLGVPERRFGEPLEQLSGGWRMRVVLARLLLGAPGLLLLDEPTNHLDLDAIDWLESFLADYPGGIVIVSHDRYFLNRMIRDVAELDAGALTTYAGDYDAFVAAKELRAEQLDSAAKRQARERARVERFIERFRYKNTKARQVQSRIRALEKTERIEAPRQVRRIRFGFPPAPRSGDIVVRTERLVKRFGAHTVHDGLELLLRRGDRVALIGPNGTGKSTLLKLIAGALAPDGGTVELGHGVVPRYYAQHQLDELDPGATALAELARAAPELEHRRLRTILGAFLFVGDDVDKRVGILSGGEKARLALARLLVRPSNLLLLDEPTNHLDLRSREVLEDAINEYTGALVVVTHDRYFMNRVATSVAAIEHGRLERYDGDYDAWLDWRRRRGEEERAEGAGDDAAGLTDDRTERRDAKRREAEERNRRYRERKVVEERMAPIEAEIDRLETERRALEQALADPVVLRDAVQAGAAGRRMNEIAGRIEQCYAAWEALGRELEAVDD